MRHTLEIKTVKALRNPKAMAGITRAPNALGQTEQPTVFQEVRK